MVDSCCNLCFSEIFINNYGECNSNDITNLTDNILNNEFFNNLLLQIIKYLKIKLPLELDLQIVSLDEMQKYNNKYRYKNAVTNILSFKNFDIINIKDLQVAFPTNKILNEGEYNDVVNGSTQLELNENNRIFLGNLVACNQVIKDEAIAYNKKYFEYWSHMFIHGTLHLLGFNHDNIYNQNIMEKIEIWLMKDLGLDHPYIYNV